MLDKAQCIVVFVTATQELMISVLALKQQLRRLKIHPDPQTKFISLSCIACQPDQGGLDSS